MNITPNNNGALIKNLCILFVPIKMPHLNRISSDKYNFQSRCVNGWLIPSAHVDNSIERKKFGVK